VLLRETLKKLDKVAVARVVIRTRESLALVRPQGDALQMILLRYPQELVAADDYTFPSSAAKSYRISDKEFAMAEQLVESMSSDFKPSQYKDDFREKLSRAIRQRLKKKGATISRKLAPDAQEAESSDKVVDFMALLQKSIASNRRTPARKTAKRRSAKAPAKAAAKARTRRAGKRA
jgi:DNA end-binding protein Ku